MSIKISTAPRPNGPIFVLVRLNLGKQPNTSRESIESIMLAIPGVTKVITFSEQLVADVFGVWLAHGAGDDTIGKIREAAEQIAAAG